MHALLDALAVDGRPPFGVPLFWPLSCQTVHCPYPLFSPMQHGMDHASVGQFFGDLFSMTNLKTITIEAAVGAVLIMLTVAARCCLRPVDSTGRHCR